jgi:2-haloacid dehalogenase
VISTDFEPLPCEFAVYNPSRLNKIRRSRENMPRTIVFDVNETLLDLKALDPLFEKHFGDAEMRSAWFTQVLLTSMTISLAGDYADFAKVGAAALRMVAERRGIAATDDQVFEILRGLGSIPAHPEAVAALESLQKNGYRLVTLTNSPPTLVEAQMKNSGLRHFFEKLLSVDSVRTFKPATAVYQMATSELGEKPEDIWLIAAHNWDTTGAVAAGWKAAFVARPGMVIGALDREPTVRGADLTEVTNQILAADAKA